jgi:hypothetical protein
MTEREKQQIAIRIAHALADLFCFTSDIEVAEKRIVNLLP